MAVSDHGCMMTQQLQASILCAPLAATDRRALSQAWYSALGYARDASSAQTTARTPHARSLPLAVHRDPPAIARLKSASPAAVQLPTARGRIVNAASSGERPAPRSALASKIEALIGAPARRHPARATLSVDGDRGRVHLILQDRGDRAYVVAVCAPRLRAAVARALSQAALMLAARGIVLQASQSEAPSCF